MSLLNGSQRTAPQHGGNALALCAQYNINPSDCIDLTAALNPEPYPVPTLPQDVWQALPQSQDGLIQAAAQYYGVKAANKEGAPHLLLVPGSTWVIHALPSALFNTPSIARAHSNQVGCKTNANNHMSDTPRVWVPRQGFSEHAYAWQKNGYKVQRYADEPDVNSMQAGDILVLINPNNPTGKLYSYKKVVEWLRVIESKSAWLIVDEAFIDVTPEHSVIQHDSDALLVMRSFGKFFGLAGIRLGAIKAPAALIARLTEQLPPWAISTPTRYIAKQAFTDTAWQQRCRERLRASQPQLVKSLTEFADRAKGRLVVTPLFYTLYVEQAQALHHALAQQGVFTRLLDDKSGIRLGAVPQCHIERVVTAIDNV